jgi:hypothetical protein
MEKCQFCSNTEKFGTWRIVPYSHKLKAVEIEYCETHDELASLEQMKIVEKMGVDYSHTFFRYAVDLF